MTAAKKHRELWTFSDLMGYLNGIPRSTVYMYIAEGKIPYIQLGRHKRFVPEEVEKAIRKLPA